MMAICEECDEREAQQGLKVCFRCKIKSVSLGFTYGKAEFHGPTIGERQQNELAHAERQGLKVEPVGKRWV